MKRTIYSVLLLLTILVGVSLLATPSYAAASSTDSATSSTDSGVNEDPKETESEDQSNTGEESDDDSDTPNPEETTTSTDAGVDETDGDSNTSSTDDGTDLEDTDIGEDSSASSTDSGVENDSSSTSSTDDGVNVSTTPNGDADEGGVDEDETSPDTDTSSEGTSDEMDVEEGMVMLHVRYGDILAFEGAIPIPTEDVEIVDNNGTVRIEAPNTVLAALYLFDIDEKSFNIIDLTYNDQYKAYLLNCMYILAANEDGCYSWLYKVNDAQPGVGMDAYTISSGDDIYLYFGSDLRARVLETELYIGESVTGVAERYAYKTNTWSPATDVTLSVVQDNPDNPWFPTVISSDTPNNSGEVTFTMQATGTYKMGISEDYYLNTESFDVIELDQSLVQLNIRSGDTILYSKTLSFEADDSVIIADDAGAEATVPNASFLGFLYGVDTKTDAFEISSFTYFSLYDSLLLNCIDSPSLNEPACHNWKYAVNGSLPGVGMDSYTLTGGEQIYLFFGDYHRLNMSTSTVTKDTTFTVNAESYDYTNDTWKTLTKGSIEITQPNPDSAWSPFVRDTGTLDDTGQATFNLSATGTYAASVLGDYYFPSISFTVIEEAQDETSDSEDNDPSPGDNGPTNSSKLVSETTINETIAAILSYIRSVQNETGAVESDDVTDWIAMAFGSQGIYADKVASGERSLLHALHDYKPTADTELNACAAYPRHVLAYLAAGIDSGEPVVQGYIERIKTECHTDNLYGQPGINDDMFALLALLATGTDIDDEVVKTTFNTILADQRSSGAFTWNGGAAPDATGGALNALKYADSKGMSVESTVYANAKTYLKSNQSADGGWGFDGETSSDINTTSWVMMGINALGEGQSEWSNTQERNPWHVLTESLTDGGFYTSIYTDPDPDWFATKHAVPALSGDSWAITLPARKLDDVIPDKINNSCSACETEAATTSTTESISDMFTTSTIDLFLDDSTSTTPTTTSTPDEVVDEATDTTTPAESLSDELSPSNDVQPVEGTEESTNNSETPVTLEVAPPTHTNAPIPATNLDRDIDVEDKDVNEQENSVQEQETIQSAEPFARRVAKGVFGSTAAGSLALGAYIGWRFLRALV